mgnify:CR=1 FL=1
MKSLYYLSDHRGAEETQLSHAECCLALAALLVDRSPKFSPQISLRIDQLLIEATLGARRGDWR